MARPAWRRARRRVRASTRSVRRLLPVSTHERRTWATTCGAALALAVPASPVGQPVADLAWCAFLLGLVAHLGATARREALVVAALVSVAGVQAAPGVACSAVAVALAVVSVRLPDRRATFVRGMSAAFSAAGALVACDSLRPAVAALILVGTIAPIAVSGYRGATRRARYDVNRLLFLVTGATVALAGVAGIGTLLALRSVDRGTTELRAGLAAARRADPGGAYDHLIEAATDLGRARRTVDLFGFAGRIVPGVAQHVDALSDVLRGMARASDEASHAADTVDVDTVLTVGGRIDTGQIDALARPLLGLSIALDDVIASVDEHSGALLVPPLHDRLAELGREARRAGHDADVGALAAEVLPGLLGSREDQRYLVLFTSPAEARGRFGFPGSFAEVIFHEGKFTLGEHGSTSQVFLEFLGTTTPDDEEDDLLRPYLPFGTTRDFRSVTLPPHFPTVAEAAAQLWEQSGRAPLDGVARFDPAALAPLLGLTGPVDVPTVGYPLHADNLEQYIAVDQYLQFPDDQAPRREVLDTVSTVTFERLETADLPSPRVLADLFGSLVRAGHLQIETFDRPGQELFAALDLDGAFPAPPRDGLLVANVNGGGNKIDAFLTRQVRYDATVDRSGTLDGHLTVALENTAPASGLPFFVISSYLDDLPSGANRTTLLVYTQVPVRAITVDGRATEVSSQRSGGRWLTAVPLDLPPGSTTTVDLHLTGEVPGGAKGYELALEPSHGVTPDQYEVSVRPAGRDPVEHRGVVEVPTPVR